MGIKQLNGYTINKISDMKKKTNLNDLNLNELHSLYDLLDDGIVDGNRTSKIRIESKSFQYEYEVWEKKYEKRMKSLEKIKSVIREKISNIDY